MSGSGPVAVIGMWSFKAWRRAGSASFRFRSSREPVVASHQGSESSKRFQSSKVKLKPASVVRPCPMTRIPRIRQLSSHARTRRWMSGRWSKAWTTFMSIGRPLSSAISS